MVRLRITLVVVLVFIGAWGTASAQTLNLEAACRSALPRSMALQRVCQALGDLGDVAEGARIQALDQIARGRQSSGQAAKERWVNIGPTPMVGGSPDTTWTARPRSGRVAAIAVDPSNPVHWLIGAAGGGVWETADGGTSWNVRTDDQPALAIGALAFAPSNPSIVYAGTGEAVFSGDAYGGMGVLKSTDGGRSWTHLTTSQPFFLNRSFSDLAVHPTNPNVVMATVNWARAWKPAAGGPQTGIYKSTVGGGSWVLKLWGEATDLEVDPRDFQRQYAGIGDIRRPATPPPGKATHGVYRSVNEGETWTPIAGPWDSTAGVVGRVELAISPSNPDVLYVSIQDATLTANGDVGGKLLGLWKTSDAWSATPTWQAIPLGAIDNGTGTFGYCGWNPWPTPRENPACYYNHVLSVDPANPNVLYAGGISLWKYDGSQWYELAFHDPSVGIHADQHRMVWAGNRLIVGNDGGVWSTTDGGATWSAHNLGLGTIQFWGGAVAPTPTLLALGGTQDNGTAVWNPTALTWTGIIRGDAGAPTISPTLPTTHWGIAGLSKELEIWRTVNAGATMEPAGTGLPASVRTGSGIAPPFVQCPANHDVVLFGGHELWKTANFFASRPGAPSWTQNNPGPTDPNLKLGSVAFAPSDTTCRTYVIGTKGFLRITTDGGTVWRNLDPNGVLPQNRVPKGLAFDPRTANTLLVAYSTFTPVTAGRVFRTANALAVVPSWTNASPPIDFPHNAIAIDPVDPSVVWAATDLGVWRGEWNDGPGVMSWRHYGPATGLPNVVVSDVKVHAATRAPVAFTHGRGAFVLVNLAALCGGAWAPTFGTNFGACPP
jgi:photosystem II stability/assembly factor-like uncharacterized protein